MSAHDDVPFDSWGNVWACAGGIVYGGCIVSYQHTVWAVVPAVTGVLIGSLVCRAVSRWRRGRNRFIAHLMIDTASFAVGPMSRRRAEKIAGQWLTGYAVRSDTLATTEAARTATVIDQRTRRTVWPSASPATAEQEA